MKRFLTLLTIALSLVLINHSCKPKEEEEPEPGSIYGVVTDKATGEPVKNANVQLRPTGETTLTGNDGRYEFLDLKNGEYSISVSKTGYTNLVDDYVITVDGPKEMRRDVQIEKYGNIKGFVRKNSLNEPIENVHISLYDVSDFYYNPDDNYPIMITATQSSYYGYIFENLKPTEYMLLFEHNDYKTEMRFITVQSDHTHVLDVLMEEK